ncbi:MAG: FAD-binding protein [Clostridia bacterium]|nr:FAD-binding protein [Clostridia bacterium]
MKITVCLKYCQGELNPFDASALEYALRIPGAEVSILTMSPPSVKEPLTQLTRLPVSEIVLLCDSAFAGSDTLATSYILAEYLKDKMPDLVLCGRQSIDGDTAQVGPCLATMLGCELVTNVMGYVSDTEVSTRDGNRTYSFPALLTLERIHNLRFFSIRSKVREDILRVIGADELGVDKSRCGLGGSPTVVVKCFENTQGRRRVKWIDKSEFRPLIERLKAEERKASEDDNDSAEKLECVTVIGADMEKIGRRIAHSVRILEDDDMRVIAEKTADDEVVLWKADSWGRNHAPIVQALLGTGLCADCTQLEIDSGEFYMYRPARSGSVTAKIKCTTKPKMATVRVESESASIVLSLGRGAIESLEAAHKFALEIGAEIGASRTVVDMGKAPYEQQVGLTGKNLSPKIYIAAGISGAVHHTCAIEGAQTIIAINPDRDARIFDYADYGILANIEDVIG